MGQVLALASGLSFGFSDFLGGMAARRAPVLSVLAISQPVGLLALLPLLLIARGELSVAAFGIGAAAGAAGTLGLVLYLRALASAAMGIVAPITAVAGASFPVGIGLIVGERPPLPAAIGIILGLAAVVLVAAERARERDGSVARSGVVLAVTAGAAFGLFMVLLHQTPVDSGAWSLIAARLCSVVIVGIGLALLGSGPLPRRSMPIAALSGFLDVGANALFLAASRTVLLSLSALLASLYPVVVVVLARGVLKERLRPTQAAGVAAALVAAGLDRGGRTMMNAADDDDPFESRISQPKFSILHDDKVEVTEYRQLRERVGWECVDQPDAVLVTALGRTINATARRRSGELVAMGRLLSDGALYASVWDMMVTPEYQHQGLGTAILNSLLDRCANLHIVVLNATSEGRRLYESVGFAPTSRATIGMILRPRCLHAFNGVDQ